MSEFKINEEVLLNGKTYKIIGTVKQSFLLEKDGKKYKATAKMMGKIKVQNKMGIGVGRKKITKKSPTYYMEKRLTYSQIFNKDAKMPETKDELMNAFGTLCGELSPENLSCDGELSRTDINIKLGSIRAEWKEIERKLGRKVSEDEAVDHFMKKWREKNEKRVLQVASNGLVIDEDCLTYSKKPLDIVSYMRYYSL